MIKFIQKIIVVLCVLSLGHSSVYANSGGAWYIKRNGNSQPKLDINQNIIYDYNGIYLDAVHDDNNEEKVLYLTFDVGYENGNVAKILDILKKEHVTGAFFVLSHFVRKNTDVALRMGDAGHLVCNHTSNHINLAKADRERAIKSIVDLENIYKDVTGRELAKFFRFPEGCYNESTLACVKELGYRSVFWSLAYADWNDDKQPNPDKGIEILLNNTHNGAIILLHPTSSTNVQILPLLIQKWRDAGYSFGSLEDIK